MVTDQEIIARASGGLALCGIYVRESDERVGSVPAGKQLLRPPENCKLMNSEQMYWLRSKTFSNIQATESFCAEVEKSGWSVAGNLHANVVGFDPKAFEGVLGRNKGKQMSLLSQDTIKEACHMQILYSLKASFAIACHQMELSEEALNDFHRVQNLSDADKFLEEYNSHVATGKYHVGGVLIKCLVMKARNTTSLERMLEKVSRHANLAAGVDFRRFKFGGNVEFANEKWSSSLEQGASNQATVQYAYTALGPQTDEELDFKAELDNKSTWDIIDRVDSSDLVPVWEIPSVKNAKDLETCCGLIREAWQSSVKNVAAERRRGRIYSLWQASYMDHLKSLLAESSSCEDLRTLKATLIHVWAEKTNLDVSRKRDVYLLNRLQELLQTLAESGETDLVDGGPALVRKLITREEQDWLRAEGIPLRGSVQALLWNEVEPTGPLPPMEDMSPGGLVDRLKTLLGQSSSGTTAFDSNAVAMAIRDVFRQNLNDGNSVDEVRRLVLIHGFDKNGVIRDITSVTRERVNALVDELEKMNLRSYQNPKSMYAKEGIFSFRAGAGPVTTASGSRLPVATIPTLRNENLDIFGRNPHLIDLGTSNKSIYPVYSRHMLVDRPTNISDNPQRRMMDRIRHRLEPFASTSSKPADGSKRRFNFSKHGARVGDDKIAKSGSGSGSTAESSPLSMLVKLLTSSDLPSQTALMQLLLDSRVAIPLVVPLKMQTTDRSSTFGHLAEALDFVRVKLAKQEILSIAEDTKLPRVVFVSNRKSSSQRETAQMASQVMHFQVQSKFFKGDTGDAMTVIELGVGFLRISESNESHDHQPCLVFCVWGDHTGLGEFLAMVADYIIVEINPSDEASCLSWITGHSENQILYWKIDPSDDGCENEPYWTVWGSFSQIADRIEEFLLEGIVQQKLFKGALEGGPTLDQCLSSIPPFNKKTAVFNLASLDGIELEKAKESLQLQRIFAKEAGFYFESLRQKAETVTYDSERMKLRNERKRLAPRILKLPLLGTFISVLSLPQYVERNIGIVNFELNIEKKLHLILKRAYEKEAQAFDRSQQYEDDQTLKDDYILARKEHMDKKLGLEHLWRELSHIFVAYPHLEYLPKLAAEHLIDGFPLEILDGDASMFNSLWVQSILDELHTVLSNSLDHKPKVFVLSVIGLQSSGKSTLLNVMFGTKLKTSAGQCTRGVYLQLIKSERKEFDYVLILDTEGIRSPEFYREKNSEVHDNRLAAFAVLPADACIVLVANEDDNGLKEVLPMVMLAFKDSAIAEQSGDRRQAKVVFAYRSVDTNDVSKLGRNQRKLQEDLRDASKQAGDIPNGATKESSRVSGSRPNYVADTLLRDFHISPTEEDSDVKYFGNLKKESVPPGDTPSWEYGTKVVRLREYIHKRVTDDGHWKGIELKSWAERLKMVWDCIGEANFEIGFRNQIEFRQYKLLQEKLLAARQTVGKKWMEEFDKVEGDLQVERDTVERPDRFQFFWKKLKLAVERTVDERADEVQRILEQPRWQKWKVDELVNWVKFRSEQERDMQRRLQDCMDGVLKFDNVVKDYYAKIQMAIQAKTRKFDMTSPNRQQNMTGEFNGIFRRILSQVQRTHPPMAGKVRSLITSVYENSGMTGKRIGFSTEEEGRVRNNFQKKYGTSVLSAGRYAFTGTRDSGPVREKQLIIADLEITVEVYLQEANHYAEHLVEEVISFTEKSIRKAQESKPVPREMEKIIHYHVKDFLTGRLTAIQETWDKNHNVSTRLEEQEQQLWQFFKSCADGVDGTQLLFTKIDSLLKSNLVDCLMRKLSYRVSDKLLNSAWAGSWIVLRAHIDLNLVELIETSNTTELLTYVRHGALHYKNVVDGLIEQEIHRQLKVGRLWVPFLEAVKQAVNISALRASASTSDSSRFSIFLQNFVELINDIGPECIELTRNISSYVSQGVYAQYDAHLNFIILSNDVCKGLNSIEPDLDSSQIEEVVKLVTARMLACATDNVGPRCAEECPHCRLTCFRRKNHDGQHDTLHQPSGLSGRHYAGTRELVPLSCSGGVMEEKFVKHGELGINTWTAYSDWEKHYTTWQMPAKASQGTVKLMEYIFAHYQEDLVKRYSTKDNRLNVCSEIPPEYLLHEIGALRRELESTTGSR